MSVSIGKDCRSRTQQAKLLKRSIAQAPSETLAFLQSAHGFSLHSITKLSTLDAKIKYTVYTVYLLGINDEKFLSIKLFRPATLEPFDLLHVHTDRHGLARARFATTGHGRLSQRRTCQLACRNAK
jgi:hypothetical protein